MGITKRIRSANIQSKSILIWFFKICLAVIATASFSTILAAQDVEPYLQVEINSLGSIPPPSGHLTQFGLAGAFSGVHNDVLIIAGGANFPDGAPWQGGKKVWWDDIYVLEKDQLGNYSWLERAGKLSQRLAYGVSVSTEDGIVCIGGEDGINKRKEVFLLSWDIEKREIIRSSFPNLPFSLAYMAGGMIGHTIYIAGGHDGNGSSTAFLSLDLDQRGAADFKWRQLEAWPGPERMLPMASVQSDGENDAFFFIWWEKCAAIQTNTGFR